MRSRPARTTGKDRAAQELERFYNEVLPTDLAAARRLTHMRLPQIAKQFNVEFYRPRCRRRRGRARARSCASRTKVELAGRYRDVRAFIHELETAPEFVVIDDIVAV